MLIALFTALVNAGVTWGIVSTKLAWLRSDIDRLEKRIDGLSDRIGALEKRIGADGA